MSSSLVLRENIPRVIARRAALSTALQPGTTATLPHSGGRLVPLTVAALVISGSAHPILDGVLGASLVIHSHIGFDSMLVDHLHPRKFPSFGKVMTWSLCSVTVATLVGIYRFNTNDVRLTEVITKVWTA